MNKTRCSEPIVVGSIYETRTRRHRGQLRQVIGLSTSEQHVYLLAYGPNPRQHKDQKYHVHVDSFRRGMVLVIPRRPLRKRTSADTTSK